MSVLVLVRHGETEWGRLRLFTGWSNPPLSLRGEMQARQAGTGLAGLVAIDRVYTSLLQRASETASILLAVAGAAAPVEADWRLNERHLGLLEGLSKEEVRATWGNEKRKIWRDDDGARPPVVPGDDLRHPRHDPRYRHVAAHLLPGAERGSETTERVLEVWHERIAPDVLAGRGVVVVSHLGPLRVLARHLSSGGTDEAPATWPNGAVRLYEIAPDLAAAQAAAAIRTPPTARYPTGV